MQICVRHVEKKRDIEIDSSVRIVDDYMGNLLMLSPDFSHYG